MLCAVRKIHRDVGERRRSTADASSFRPERDTSRLDGRAISKRGQKVLTAHNLVGTVVLSNSCKTCFERGYVDFAVLELYPAKQRHHLNR